VAVLGVQVHITLAAAVLAAVQNYLSQLQRHPMHMWLVRGVQVAVRLLPVLLAVQRPSLALLVVVVELVLLAHLEL